MATSPIEPDGPMEPDGLRRPITPHAAPIFDGQGHLAYIGVDGRRYVVGLPPETDGDTVDRDATCRRVVEPAEQLRDRRFARTVDNGD